MVVFLLLGVIWAAVLIPPWLQSRREARPIASIMSFRSQLWSLERATPRYGADTYVAYGDDVYDDELVADELHDDTGRVADVHTFDPNRRSVAAEAMVPGVIGAVVRGPSEGVAGSAPGVPVAAVVQRRAMAYRRRRQVLAALLLATVAAVAPAVALRGPWLVVVAVVSTLLVAYLGLLIRRGRQQAERAQKVRYLTPIRAPRPSVVIIGSGARPVAGG